MKEACKRDQAIDELVQYQVCKDKEIAVKLTNKLLYEAAEKQGVSLYTVCFNFVPDIKREWNMEKNTIDYEATLKPLQFDFEHDGGYWKNKYYELKKQIQELINENRTD